MINMAIPKAPDILRPDLKSDCYRKLSEAIDKLDMFVKRPYKQILRDSHFNPIFNYKYARYNTIPKTGCVVAQFFRDSAKLGYIISATQESMNVIFINDDNNGKHYYSYTRIEKTKMFFNSSFTSPIMISEMNVDEFVNFVDEKVYEERHLDNRAKITNRELREIKEELYMLKRNFNVLKMDFKKNYEERYMRHYDSTLEELDL